MKISIQDKITDSHLKFYMIYCFNYSFYIFICRTFLEDVLPKRKDFFRERALLLGENRVKISPLFLTSETLDFEPEYIFESPEHPQSTPDMMPVLTSF